MILFYKYFRSEPPAKYLISIMMALLLLPHNLNAQSLTKISGTIKDETGQTLDGVTVTLTGADGKVFSTFADLGKFLLANIPQGRYTLTASLVGYQISARDLSVPADTVKIIMLRDSKQLKEVSISFSRPLIERKADRVVFNIENSLAASGGSAWDALSKSPGVQTKSDGTLTAGSKNVQVYLDGKPLHLSGNDLLNYLQGLPAGMVSRIEVFTSPPASFDAEGGAVINIITRRSVADGLNVNLNSTYTRATYGSYSTGASFNYRKNNLNIYGSYSFSDLKRTKDQNDYMTFSTTGESSFWYSPGHTIYNSKTSAYKLGADYQIGKNQIFGLLITGSNRSGVATSNSATSITNNFKASPDSILETNGMVMSSNNRYAYNVNYNVKLDSSSRSLNLDLDYSPYTNTSAQYVSSYSLKGDGQQLPGSYHIYTPSVQQINIYSGKLDYNYKAGHLVTLVSGIKYSSIQSDDRFDEYNNGGQTPVRNPGGGNNFRYTENTAAAYTAMNGNFGRWTVQAGLRAEYTRTAGETVNLDSIHRSSYFKLFPSLVSTYALNEHNELQFTYGYRIERPEYRRLNPLKIYKNPYNILQGNPALQPAFIQNFELSLVLKKQFVFSAYYTVTNDRFSNATVQNDHDKLFTDIQENLGRLINTGFRQTIPLKPFSWWDITATAEEYYQQDRVSYLGSGTTYNKFAFDINATQSFTIDKKYGIRAELSGFYYSDESEGIFRGGGASEVDAGLKANLFSGNASIKIAAGDVFYGNTSTYKVNYQAQNNGFFQKNDTRTLSINFSYKLGKSVAASRKRNTAGEEEKQRAANLKLKFTTYEYQNPHSTNPFFVFYGYHSV